MTMRVTDVDRIYRAGRKVQCPACGRLCMSQKRKPFRYSGIGAHIREKHPELEAGIHSEIRHLKPSLHTNVSYPGFDGEHSAAIIQIRLESEERKKLEEKEEQERPLRMFAVSGKFLDEVRDQIQTLIGWMEPYYSQCNGGDAGELLIERIEEMHRAARKAEAAQ